MYPARVSRKAAATGGRAVRPPTYCWAPSGLWGPLRLTPAGHAGGGHSGWTEAAVLRQSVPFSPIILFWFWRLPAD